MRYIGAYPGVGAYIMPTLTKNTCIMSVVLPSYGQLCPIIIDPDVWTSLQQRFRRRVVPDVIQDVYDGEAYKEHAAFLANPANISLVCNTDGVALFTSSTVEIWPVWLSINELPRHER